jgi:hypothetical protein
VSVSNTFRECSQAAPAGAVYRNRASHRTARPSPLALLGNVVTEKLALVSMALAGVFHRVPWPARCCRLLCSSDAPDSPLRLTEVLLRPAKFAKPRRKMTAACSSQAAVCFSFIYLTISRSSSPMRPALVRSGTESCCNLHVPGSNSESRSHSPTVKRGAPARLPALRHSAEVRLRGYCRDDG